MSQPPGHYPAEGDPPNTVRYWDGEQWVGAVSYTHLTLPTNPRV